MDKYEFNLKADQMLKLSDRGDYATAMKIADGIDWRRVSSVSLLTRVSEIYEKNREFNEAKEILLLAFERAPISRGILFKLTELALKDGKVSEAEAYFREFRELAPEDVRQHLLRYMILKEKNAPSDQVIRPLEIYNSTEYDEKWLYELAYAYHNAGRSAECISTCDRVMLLFGTGEYVDKAIALKTEKEGCALTPYQQKLVDEKELREAQLKQMEEEYLIRNSVSASPAPAAEPEENEAVEADDAFAPAQETSEAEDPSELIRRMQNQFRSEAGIQPEMAEEQPTVEISEERAAEIEEAAPVTEEASEAELNEAVRQDKGVEIPGFVESEDMVAAAEAAVKPAEQDEIDREIEAHIAEIEAEMKASGQTIEEAPEHDSEMERYAAMVRAEAEREAEREAARAAAAAAIPERSVSYEEQEVSAPEEEISEAAPVYEAPAEPEAAPVEAAPVEEPAKQAPIPQVPDGETRVLPKIGKELQSGETKVLPSIGGRVKAEEPVPKKAVEISRAEMSEIVKPEIVKPGDGNGVVRGRTPEESFQLAVAELKRVHGITGLANSVAKIKAEKLNALGVKNAEAKMAGRDLIIEEAGDLSAENIEQLIDLLKREDGGRTVLLVDNPLQINNLLAANPELALILHEKVEEAPEKEAAPAVKPAPAVKKPEAPAAAPKAEAKPIVKAAEKPVLKQAPIVKAEEPAENKELLNDPERAYAEEELSIDAFAHYAGDYAKKIDCVITGKSMLALYERIEIMQEDGVPLTRKNAEALIEEAADSAENPPLMKKLGSLFSHKYDKDGMLILKEEDFIS